MEAIILLGDYITRNSEVNLSFIFFSTWLSIVTRTARISRMHAWEILTVELAWIQGWQFEV